MILKFTATRGWGVQQSDSLILNCSNVNILISEDDVTVDGSAVAVEMPDETEDAVQMQVRAIARNLGALSVDD